jgi:hypothetical protein
MLSDEQTTHTQFEILRQMSPQRRLALAEGMYRTAHKMKTAWVRQQHRDWSDAQVAAEVARIFLNGRS